MVRLVLMVPTDAFTSLGTTSPRYIMAHAMYLPWRGSHLAIMLDGSNTLLLSSDTDNCSWYAFSAEITGAYDDSMKCILGYGTKLVWKFVRSMFRAPSKRREAVNDDITCNWKINRRHRRGFAYLGDEAVQVGVSGALDVQAAAADIVDGFVVIHHRYFGVLQEGVTREDTVVRLHHSARHLGAGEDAHGQLRLLAIIHRQSLQ